MKNIFLNTKRTKNDLSKEQADQFLLELAESGRKNAFLISIILILIHIPLLYLDFYRYQWGFWEKQEAFSEIAWMHIILVVVLSFYSIFYLIFRYHSSFWINLYAYIFMSFFIQIWAAVFSAIDQKIFGDMSIYAIAIFGLPYIFHIPIIYEGLKIILAQIVFVYCIFRFNINPDKVDGILINSTVSVILAFVASRINYSYQESRFIQIRKIEEQKIELEKKNESQDIVLKVVAHDLRNPLSNIIGFISVIRMKYADMNLTGYLDLMEKVSRGAIQIIQDLVEVIGLENNSNPLTFQKIELNQYIEQSIYMNQNMGAKKEIVLNFSPDKGAILVNISPEKFSRVIENLLSNAIKFSNTKSEIRIIVKKESDKAKIIIQDFGIGIPVSMQKNLFQKFSNARRRGTEGEMSVGLGMYIVYEIVTLHRGKITFTSEEGKGTTFIIELPIII